MSRGRPMKQKKPIQQAIEAVIWSPQTGDELRGTFYANDFGDGAKEHHLDGYLTNSQGVKSKFQGRLSGVQFAPREARGAPRKTARDVALFLAFKWFHATGGGASKTVVERNARDCVMGLWAELGYKGVTEETHLRKRLKSGAGALNGLSLLRYVCTTDAPDGAVVAAPYSAFDLRRGESMSINGSGWFWRYGMEAAVQGRFSAKTSLSED